MVERIRTLLETRQLTPTQFADAIGIARPIVSHILSGRNKPSLEVVQRILAAMPDLSMPWLLNGTGPMLAAAMPLVPVPPPTALAATPLQKPGLVEKAPIPAAAAEPEAPVSSHLSRPAPVLPASMPLVGPTRPMPRRFTSPANRALTADEPALSASASQLKPETLAEIPTTPAAIAQEPAALPESDGLPDAEPLPPVVTPDTLPAAASTAAALLAGSEKPIRRIVIFYRDGSFADYQPE